MCRYVSLYVFTLPRVEDRYLNATLSKSGKYWSGTYIPTRHTFTERGEKMQRDVNQPQTSAIHLKPRRAQAREKYVKLVVVVFTHHHHKGG